MTSTILDSQHDIDSIAMRLASAESNIAALQPDSDTSTATSVSSTSVTGTSGMSFYPLPETALGLTQDAAWHTITVASVPSNAKALVILVQQKATNLIAANVFKMTNDASHATFYTVAYMDCAIGANRYELVTQVMIPVTGMFDYYIDNDADWTVAASIQGYWA